MNRYILEMREYQYDIKYVKGKYNWVADQLSRPVLVIRRPPVETWLGKTKEEMRELQLGEEGWRYDSVSGGWSNSYSTLPEMHPKPVHPMGRGPILLCNKKDGSVQFCLVVPQALKKEALQHAHVKLGHLGQKKTLTSAENLFY